MKHKDIVLASNNAAKFWEVQAFFKDLPFNIVPMYGLAVPNVAETGLTFVENALIKARHASRHTDLPAIADDSGLEVPALKGAPGIYSSRYSGPKATDHDNIQKLLKDLQEFPEVRREARFVCVIVFLEHADCPTPIICQGTWTGRIQMQPSGHGGFGYDPVFYINELAKTAAEIPMDQKNNLSHRGQALRELSTRMQERYDAFCA